jgi:tetratricopeptide (TPR) repeat protein
LYENDFYVIHPGTAQHMDLDHYDARWNKIKLLYDAIQPNGWGQHCDYVMWVDADWIVLDMKWDIAAIVSAHPTANIIVSAEHAGSTTRMNSGAVLVRNSAWSRTFLWDWWTIADRRMFSDQEQFDLLYQQRQQNHPSGTHPKACPHIVILAPEAMNSDPPAMTQLRANHAILHLMGEENEYRERAFRQAWTSICRTISTLQSNASPQQLQRDRYTHHVMQHMPRQLNISQPVLLQLTVDVYGELLGEEFAPFRACSSSSNTNRSDIDTNRGDSDSDSDSEAGNSSSCQQRQSLEVSRRLSNMVHHFVHALEHTVDAPSIHAAIARLSPDGVVPTTSNVYAAADAVLRQRTLFGQRLRYQLYQFLCHNLHLWRRQLDVGAAASTPSSSSIRGVTTSIPTDYPELLKTVAIAGQHLLPAPFASTLSTAHRIRIAADIEGYLDEMMAVADRRQHAAIQQMAIHHLLQEGDIAVSELPHHHGGLLVATSCFARAVALAEEHLVATFGAHHLVEPLVLLANTQAMQRQFPDARRTYDRALRIARDAMGPWHLSLSHVYYNYARACLEAGEDRQARQLIDDVQALLHMHGAGAGDDADAHLDASLRHLIDKVAAIEAELHRRTTEGE